MARQTPRPSDGASPARVRQNGGGRIEIALGLAGHEHTAALTQSAGWISARTEDCDVDHILA